MLHSFEVIFFVSLEKLEIKQVELEGQMSLQSIFLRYHKSPFEWIVNLYTNVVVDSQLQQVNYI